MPGREGVHAREGATIEETSDEWICKWRPVTPLASIPAQNVPAKTLYTKP